MVERYRFMPFDSPDINLGDLLKDVGSGKIRLPDFQREWKWDSDRIAGLLASVSLGYPVGVVMLLETGGGNVQFAARAVSGVAEQQLAKEAEQLILDGQQRLTSLYQSLASGQVVHTQDSRNKKRIDRWYYLSIDACLDGDEDRGQAVVAIPEDRKLRDNFGRDVTLDLSSRALEHQAGYFPLSLVFDAGEVFEWANGYAIASPGGMERWKAFYDRVLKNFVGYTVPVIVLKRDTPRDAVCTVFEKVNTGGVVLDVFELLTATFAATHFDLRADWDVRYRRLAGHHRVLRGLQSTDFLQAVTLSATRRRHEAWEPETSEKAPAVSCRRAAILDLTVGEYQGWADAVEQGFDWAAKFLNRAHIFEARDVPYRTQLVPLAAIHVALGVKAETIGAVGKIRRWFWCGVLGEAYGGATETRFANDLVQVVEWVAGSSIEPATVTDSSFEPNRLLSLRTRGSAAYKGVYALLMAKGCPDWLYDEEINLASHHRLAVDIHHVFPKAWCHLNGIDDIRRESIVNKTAISAATNRTIGGRAPSKYLPLLAGRAEVAQDVVERRIAVHQIDPSRLAADDFDGYFEARRLALLDVIAAATGKQAIGVAAPASEIAAAYEIDDEDDDDVSDDDIDSAASVA